MAAGQPITLQQKVAIAEAMLSGKSAREAGHLVGVTESAVYRLRGKDPEFQQLQRALSQAAVESAHVKMQGIANRAVATLSDILSLDAAAEVNAKLLKIQADTARFILDSLGVGDPGWQAPTDSEEADPVKQIYQAILAEFSLDAAGNPQRKSRQQPCQELPDRSEQLE